MKTPKAFEYSSQGTYFYNFISIKVFYIKQKAK